MDQSQKIVYQVAGGLMFFLESINRRNPKLFNKNIQTKWQPFIKKWEDSPLSTQLSEGFTTSC